MLRPGLVSLSSPSGGGSYTAKAVHFDGTQFLNTNSLVATDNAFMSGAFWFREAALPGDGQLWTVDPAGAYTSNGNFGNGFNGQILEFLANSNNSSFVQVAASGTPVVLDVWHSIVFSLDGSTGAGKLYLDRVDITHLTTQATPFVAAFNSLPFYIGADTFSGDEFIGDLADLWLAPGQLLLVDGDIPSATLDKFVTAGLKPVFLGADGSIPTGTAPAIFFSGDAAAFGQPNLGTGGTFTLTGALTNASSSPSD
jgi:hypothetical protein